VLAVTVLRTWAVLVILLLAGLADEAGRVHATIMPELQKNNRATHPLQLRQCRVRLCVIVTDVMTTIEAAGEGVPRLGGQS
jgi:hypothetical protein